VEIEVATRQAGKRAVALHARMTQGGTPVTDATVWFIAEGIAGFEHDVAAMPDAPEAETLRPYQQLAENYAEWYPFWRNVEGRPLTWDGGIGPPEYRAWFRLLRPFPAGDAVLDAARQLLWLDTMMWNAVPPPHGWPAKFIAPSLDLTAQFHAFDPAAEFLLADATAPVARDGLASCNGRVWSPSGRLLASGTSQLLCRPAPS
jgi:acyl-CoA thioesterase